MKRGLFMTNQDVLEFILVKNRVVNMQDRATWVAKYKFNLFFMQAAY